MTELDSRRDTSEQSKANNVVNISHLESIELRTKSGITNIVHGNLSKQGFDKEKYIDTFISKEITNIVMGFSQLPLLVMRITEHMNLCRVQGFYSQLILNSEEIEKMTNGELKIDSNARESYIMNFRFENLGNNSFLVHHQSLTRLEYNPILNNFGWEMIRMINDTGLELSSDILDRFIEISEHFDSRYGNGFSSMTRMMTVMANAGMIGKIFQKVPNDIFEKITQFHSSNSYVNIYRNYLISVIKRFEGNGEPGGYTLFRSGLSPRDKSCKDVEQYFGFIFQEDNSTLKKKYRIIGDFLEKNIERTENFRTALSTKEVIVDGIRYPKGFLFRLHVNDGKIVGVEPLRITIFCSDTLMRDGKDAFGNQFQETIQRLISDDILPGNDLLDRMVGMVKQAT